MLYVPGTFGRVACLKNFILLKVSFVCCRLLFACVLASDVWFSQKETRTRNGTRKKTQCVTITNSINFYQHYAQPFFECWEVGLPIRSRCFVNPSTEETKVENNEGLIYSEYKRNEPNAWQMRRPPVIFRHCKRSSLQKTPMFSVKLASKKTGNEPRGPSLLSNLSSV